MCNYLSIPEVFADFLNGTIFDGRREVSAKHLVEHNSVLYDITKQEKLPKNKVKSTKKTKTRSRDSVKYLFEQNQYLIIGIEAQNLVNYAMPLRCMEYDVMEYKQQMTQIIYNNQNNQEHKTHKNGASFLSGMDVSDKLCPVTTLVFYHGNDVYNGCKTLHEMLEWNHKNEGYNPFIADYKMNLIILSELDESIFETGLRDLIGLMKNSKSRQALQQYVNEHKDRMGNLDELTYDTIGVMINHKDIENYKESCRNKEGGIDMCQAIIEMIEEGRGEGLELGREEEREFIINNMMQKGYTMEQISEITGLSLKQIETVEI